jgi:hypothetical protein
LLGGSVAATTPGAATAGPPRTPSGASAWSSCASGARVQRTLRSGFLRPPLRGVPPGPRGHNPSPTFSRWFHTSARIRLGAQGTRRICLELAGGPSPGVCS